MHPVFEFILTAFYILIFLWVISRLKFFKQCGLSKKYLYSAFMLKIIFGTFLIFIYSCYYTDRTTADIFKYFDDSYHMHKALLNNPKDYFQMLLGIDNDSEYFNQYYREMNNWFRKKENVMYNDAHTIIRFNALVRIFSFGIIHVHTVVICFLSLCGLTAIYTLFKKHLNERKKLFAFFLFYTPSVLLWTSGVLKEGLLIFALGMIFYYSNNLLNKKYTFYNVAGVMFCAVLLFYLKIYVISALIPCLTAFVWVQKTAYKHLYLKYLSVVFLFILIAMFSKYISPVYDIPQIIFEKQRDFINLSQYMNAGSMIYIYPLDGSLISFLIATPVALFNAFLRPLPFDSFSPLQLASSIETLSTFLMLIYSLYKPLKLNRTQLNYVACCLLYVILVFLMIGYVTPVSGAIVRYKVPAIPFLFFAILIIANKKAVSVLEKIILRLPIAGKLYKF